MRRLIVLRPEPGASQTVERARALGLEAIPVPLFRIEPIPWQLPDSAEFDALLLTSANAVRHGGAGLNGLRTLPVHAVGRTTADAAREAGFQVASIGEGGIDALLDGIAPGTRLLQLAGEDRRRPAGHSCQIRAVAVYRAVPLQGILDIGNCVAAVHSPRAAHRLAELVPETKRATIAIAAISPRAARAAGGGWQAVEPAESPDDAALLALAARLCNNSSER